MDEETEVGAGPAERVPHAGGDGPAPTRRRRIVIGAVVALVCVIGLRVLDAATRPPGGHSSSSYATAPDGVADDEKARYFNLGKSVSDRGIFTIFWTDGKRYRAILSRDMTPEELSFYDRKNAESTY